MTSVVLLPVPNDSTKAAVSDVFTVCTATIFYSGFYCYLRGLLSSRASFSTFFRPFFFD